MEKKNEKVAVDLLRVQKITKTKKELSRTALVFVAGCAIGAFAMSMTGSSYGSTAYTTARGSGSNAGDASTALVATSTVGSGTSADTGLVTGSVASGVASGAVSVGDQAAGSSVIVDSVTVPPPGVWVAVQETHGDQLGNVLGATRVHGPRSNVVVSLLRNTEPNRTYAVVLYRAGDDGGVFDLHTESAYVDFDTGERVIVPFRTTPTAPVATTSASITL